MRRRVAARPVRPPAVARALGIFPPKRRDRADPAAKNRARRARDRARAALLDRGGSPIPFPSSPLSRSSARGRVGNARPRRIARVPSATRRATSSSSFFSRRRGPTTDPLASLPPSLSLQRRDHRERPGQQDDAVLCRVHGQRAPHRRRREEPGASRPRTHRTMTSFRRLAFASRPRVFFFSPSSLTDRSPPPSPSNPTLTPSPATPSSSSPSITIAADGAKPEEHRLRREAPHRPQVFRLAGASGCQRFLLHARRGRGGQAHGPG